MNGAVLVVLISCAVLLVESTSDRTVKRRAVRSAAEIERWFDRQNDAIEDAEIAVLQGESGNITDPASGTSSISPIRFNRHMLEFLGPNPRDKLGEGDTRAIRETVNMTFLQCAHHAQRWLKLFVGPNQRLAGEFLSDDGEGLGTADPFAGFTTKGASPCGPSRNCSSMRNPCALHFIPYESIFSGVDKVILVGDSTILRDFKYIAGEHGASYRQKVSDLPRPHIVNRLKLQPSGRMLEIHFFRLLYASKSERTIDSVMNIATPATLILFALGPHDTSWLIFDRLTFTSLGVMPGMALVKDYDKKTGKRYKQSDVLKANTQRAMAYWRLHTSRTAQLLGQRLQEFEVRQRELRIASGRRLTTADGSALRLRPLVVFREQLMPKCSDPKYANSPHAHCVGLLKAELVPFMRSFLRAQLALINVPVIGMDALSSRPDTPCYLADAGHMPRHCKSIELQLVAQMFRLAKRLRILQGFPVQATPDGGYGNPPRASALLAQSGLTWQQLANRISLLRPAGSPHPHPFVKEHFAELTYESLIAPASRNSFSEVEWAMLQRFGDDESMLELIPTDTNQIRNISLDDDRKVKVFEDFATDNTEDGTPTAPPSSIEFPPPPPLVMGESERAAANSNEVNHEDLPSITTTVQVASTVTTTVHTSTDRAMASYRVPCVFGLVVLAVVLWFRHEVRDLKRVSA